MKHLTSFLIFSLGFLTMNLNAQTLYQVTLDGSQEVPPNPSLASGEATLILNAAEDALTYTITISGLDLDGNQTPMDASDDVTGMHIHFAPAGANGGVVFGLINPGHDVDDIIVDPVAGTVSGIWENTDVNPLSAQLANLKAGNLYLNVHTVTYPGGEIRAQITGGAPIPTLTQWGIITMILLLVIIGSIAIKANSKSRGLIFH